ncbi:MAG: chromate transporter, partial [Clostridia bacterium]
FLLVAGALPYWERIRRRKEVRAALWGVNAAVVGILLAALYDPIFTKAIHTPADFSLALGGFGLLKLWRLPSWCLVLLMAAAGMALQALG